MASAGEGQAFDDSVSGRQVAECIKDPADSSRENGLARKNAQRLFFCSMVPLALQSMHQTSGAASQAKLHDPEDALHTTS
jgi:hypothetical protein